MDHNGNTRRTLSTHAILGVLVLFAFWPVIHHEFVLFDDPLYVTANPHVSGGLTLASIRWAFATGYYANWIPLTMLSHMCDVELFGLNAGWHHLTSLLFHLANTLLLFELLRRTTGAHWRSAMVAALFAVHPLRVESVAWVSERKDVLSAFFFMLTLLAYAYYAQTILKGQGGRFPRSAWYCIALFFFTCGLMSKAMVVTIPGVLLLLDFWPLRRFQCSSPKHLLLEKVPFLALAVAAGVITFCTQQAAGAMGMVRHLSLGARIANALVSYMKYVWKTGWPSNLAVLYPYQQIPFWQAIIACAVILLLSAGAFRLRLRCPYVLVGWLWFLGTLVPVIGLIQVGDQAMSDRYTYIPSIGLFLLGVWWVSDLAAELPLRRYVLTGTAVGMLAILTVTTRHQLTYWKTSRTLFEHDVLVTGGSGVIYNNLGTMQAEQGHWSEAEKLFLEALRRQPDYDPARANLAWVLASEGKSAEAEAQLTGMDPIWELEGHRLLARTFTAQAKAAEATTQYREEVRLAPTNATLRESLGRNLYRQGRFAEASDQFSELVRLRSDADAHWQLALALQAKGNAELAITHYREAIRLKPDGAEPLNDLAWLLATCPRPERRDGPEAVRLAERACALNGYKDARFMGTLDAAYAEAGRFAEAIATAEQTRQMAQDAGEAQVAAAAAERLALYRVQRAYHEP